MLRKSGFNAEWYAPDGRLYYTEDLSSDLRKYLTFMDSVLKLPQPLPKDLFGVWRVIVRKKDQVVDDRRFKVV